jgi:hypothetical protein
VVVFVSVSDQQASLARFCRRVRGEGVGADMSTPWTYPENVSKNTKFLDRSLLYSPRLHPTWLMSRLSRYRTGLFWIGDTELTANLACEEIGNFRMPWDRRNAAWIREIDILLCFDPSSASTHPNRSKCRLSSRRFT